MKRSIGDTCNSFINFKKSNLANRFRAVRYYRQSVIETRNCPPVMHVELTNVCNLKCTICPRTKMTRKQGFITLELIDKIISETKNKAEFVTLNSWGESILHPEIDIIGRKFKGAGFKIQLSTNATLLTHERQEKLMKSGIDVLLFSIDATSEKTYNKVRTGGDFKETVNNIETFLNKVKSNKIPIKCVCQLIYNKLNMVEAKAFREYWKKRGTNVWIKPFINWNGQDETENSFFPGYMPKYSGSICDWPWRQIVIHWNGNVVPCCCDYNGEMVMGNVYEKTVLEIWNGEAFQNFRKKHIENRKLIKFCENCIYEPIGAIKQIAFVMFDYLQSLKIQMILENYFRITI